MIRLRRAFCWLHLCEFILWTMTGEESIVPSRYEDVLYRDKPGTLIINPDKVVFRPKEDAAPGRSWRWSAIDRVEVMDPDRGSPHRILKLKSSSCDKRTISITIPRKILSDILQDMNRCLAAQPDSLGVEGPVQQKAHLQHKQVAPVGHRRRSTNTPGGRSTSQRDLVSDRPVPARRLQRTRSRSLTHLDERKRQQQQQAEEE